MFPKPIIFFILTLLWAGPAASTRWIGYFLWL